MNLKINDKIFEKFPQFETERLILRRFKSSDSNDLYKLRSDSEIMKYMDVEPFTSLKTAEEFIARIKESFDKQEGINWVISQKTNDEFIGYIGIWRIDTHNCRGEIGYALSQNSWGNGFMVEALKSIISFAFDKLKVHSLEANVNPQNISSIKLLEKCKFVKEAYFKENFLFRDTFKDSIIYSLLENGADG